MDPIVVELISDPQLLKVCRACLAIGIKMFSLHEGELNREFIHITGLQLAVNDGLPCHICYICRALLKNAVTFRNNCYSSHKVLSKQVLTSDFMKHGRLYSKPLMRTNIQTMNSTDNEYADKSHSIEIEEESSIDLDSDINNIDQNDDQPVTDEILNTCKKNRIIEYFNQDIDSKVKLDVINTEGKHVKVNKKKKCYNTNSGIGVLLKSSFDELKNSFKKHRDHKHIDGTNHKNDESYSDDDFKPLSSYAAVHTVNAKNDKSDSKNMKFNYFIGGENAAKVKIDKDTVKRKRTKKSKKEIRSNEALEKFNKTYNCKVVELTIQEQIEVVKARADNKKYKYGKYRCDDCYTGFVVESKFICHRKTHDPAISGDIECEICHVRFKYRLQYKKHTLRHKYKYICKDCDAVSYSRSFAKNHFEYHAGIKYECRYCKQVFSKYASRVNHMRNKHGSAECEICHDLFGAGGLALHMSLAHKQTYKCSSCDRVFNDPDALKRHMKSPYEDVCDLETRPCTRCGECFRMDDDDVYRNHIEQHRAMKKKKSAVTNENGRRRMSNKCGLVSNEADDETSRANISVDSTKDAINSSDAKSKGRGAEKTKLMCEICALDNFKSITALRYHQRIHTGEKPYACPTCPKRFRLTHTLQWHIRTHTGVRPYSCTECPKAFKTNTALCRHKLVHTNERRHVCNLCGKAFQTSTNVKLHIRTVHMKIPMPPRVRNRKKPAQESGETC